MARVHEHTVNIAAPLTMVSAIPLAMQGDAEADELRIRVVKDKDEADMTGYSVGGYLERADGKRVALTGTASDSLVTVTLNEACYRVEGSYKAFVRLSKENGEKMTLFYFAGRIENEGDGEIVIDESTLPSADELIDMIKDIDEQLERLDTLVNEAEATITQSGAAQVRAVEAKGAQKLEAIEKAGDNEIAAVAGKINELNAASAQAQAAIENKAANALASIPEDYKEIDEEVKSLKETKADVIMDESPKAASHELHAQDGKLGVTLYGQTTETGTGDKSPDNPYTISGVDATDIHVGSKNLLCLTGRTEGQAGAYANTTLRNYETDKYYVGVTRNNYSNKPSMSEWTIFEGGITVNGNSGGYGIGFPVRLLPGVIYTVSFNGDGIAHVGYYDKNGKIIGHQDGANTKQFTPPNGTDIAVVVLTNRTAGTAVTFTNVQLEVGSTSTPYEPYTANVITPALLPDGAPLMGNGTVCDTIENYVLSGCDKRIVLTGAASEDWVMWYSSATYRAYKLKSAPANLEADASGIRHIRTSRFPAVTDAKAYNGGESCCAISDDGFVGIGFKVADYPAIENNVDSLRAYLATNPLTVFYRSTDYTPEKDLRVCKVTRNWKHVQPNTTNRWVKMEGVASFYCASIVKGDAVPHYISHFKYYRTYAEWFAAAKAGEEYASNITSGVLYISTKNDMTVEEFKTWWATLEPVDVWWKIPAPEVYYTDPLPLRKPSGIMPVTVTGSGETAVSYPRDTKDWGKNAATVMIGAAESGMTATQNYASGAFIVNKDTLTLYRATKAIANGETITPGTNCAATTVVEQLANLYTLLNA